MAGTRKCVAKVVASAALSVLLAIPYAGVSSSQERTTCITGTPGTPTAFIDSSTEGVVVRTSGGQEFIAKRDILLCPGDEVRTNSTSRVSIRFDDKRTVIRLDGNSRTRVLSGGTGSADVSLLSGVLYFISSVRTQFEVDTPYIVAGIEGTEALVGIQPKNRLALATVREGIVQVSDKLGGPGRHKTISAGEAAFRSEGIALQTARIEDLKPPFSELLIASPSAVDWFVYYPPILLADNSKSNAVRDAARLLVSGDFDRADRLLDYAMTEDPARAAALRTVIAIGRNRIEDAQNWSNEALRTGPDFASSHIAASYVRQAEGDLRGAIEAATEAVSLAARNAYASARLAELYMILGDRRQALEIAEASLALEKTPLALFVAGLAQLAASDYEAADAYFNKAASLDSQAPLPRLGMGLSLIRQGDIAGGTWEIERAVALDPRRASLRNWLGRGYLAEGLSSKAASQFQTAQGEDPEDPLSYLFAALELYAANQPIPALNQLQLAAATGNARRVLRSNAGLREDSATTGAALGRIYDVLSFDQLAIEEGAKAVEIAPSNPGAHRFLSDAYGALPGYEIAQTSELLLSQILSPPSNTPLQPVLAESDLGLLDTSGPSRVTFAEFAPLFDSDGLSVYGSGLGGTQATWGDEVSITGLYRNASFSVGQYHYETDGYLRNNDLEDSILAATTTIALTPEFSLYGEYRHRSSEGGDRQIDFNPFPLSADARTEFQREIARVGFHAQPSVNSHVLGLYTWATRETKDVLPFDVVTDLISKSESTSQSGQLQYILEGAFLRVVAGGSVVSGDVETTERVDILAERETHDINLSGAYSYFYFDAPQRVSWTVGGSLVQYTEDLPGGVDTLEFLPKFGVRAELSDSLTVRAAYTRSLKPFLVTEQVLEPTSVAGFNQLYDTYNGALLDQVGVGLDLKLNENIRIGGSAVFRNYEIPVLFAPDEEIKERVYSGYVYATLSENMALSAEAVYESASSESGFLDFDDWHVLSIPLTLSYFSEDGWFASGGVEFVDHSFDEPGNEGSDQFALLGAAVGYRLPNKRGIISLEGQNLLDQEFRFQNRTGRYELTAPPRYAPDLTILVRGTFSF